MIWLIFFGRLEAEKWIPGIIEMVHLFGKDNDELPFDLFVFWSWVYESHMRSLSQRYKQVHFFWRQNMDTIRKYSSMCKYALMPSECLESFWLWALTSLNQWIPVIWYAKWWLEPFIYPELDISHCDGKNTWEKLYQMIKKLIKHPPKLDRIPRDIAQEYTIGHWKENISYIIGSKPQKILLVSDFINKVWWIETYVNDCKSILENMWHQVELFWANCPKWKRSKLFKILWIFVWLFNIIEAHRLKNKIEEFKPDIIRHNSILRYLWRMSINQWDENIKKILMFHDLGYVHPFPSKLYQSSQIPKRLSFRKFIRASKTVNPLIRTALFLKYLSLKLIKRSIRIHIDTFIVPSRFMKDSFAQMYNIPEKKLHIVPHFIQS